LKIQNSKLDITARIKLEIKTISEETTGLILTPLLSSFLESMKTIITRTIGIKKKEANIKNPKKSSRYKDNVASMDI
jgi:hypothetical protein